MRSKPFNVFLFTVAFGLLSLVDLAACGSTETADLKFEARLVWGTDQEKPVGTKLHDLPPHLNKKLAKIFRWKHYFGISQELSVVPYGKVQKIKMSDKCYVKVRNAGNRQVEVSVYGEGKHILTKKQEVVPKEYVIVAGDCEKDDTAWFVVLQPIGLK